MLTLVNLKVVCRSTDKEQSLCSNASWTSQDLQTHSLTHSHSMVFIMITTFQENVFLFNMHFLKLCSFGSKIGNKFTHLSQTEIFLKISFISFLLLIICHYGVTFQKNPQSKFQNIKLCTFGPKIGAQFTHLPQKRLFWEISFISFFSTLYCSLCCKV